MLLRLSGGEKKGGGGRGGGGEGGEEGVREGFWGGSLDGIFTWKRGVLLSSCFKFIK